MGWTDGFIAVDWGTTNRRAYLIGSGGDLQDEFEDDLGILSVGPEGFPYAVRQIETRLGDRPMLMAGMIGSNRGWIEAAYVPCPAGIDALVGALRWPEPGRIAIVPGVSYQTGAAADVMRGEETQFLGAVAAGLVPADATCCHPGTHNKWAQIEAGRLTRFRTVMTGELFSLLREHSILADLLSAPAPAGSAFEEGVAHGLAHDDLAAELFSVRARVLLGKAEAAEAPSYVSGLLIGSDLRLGLRRAPEGAIVTMGRPELTVLFAAALKVAGREALVVDGETAFLAGARKIVERIA
jgi:2-dehydro-3-deoxygalactonokinase